MTGVIIHVNQVLLFAVGLGFAIWVAGGMAVLSGIILSDVTADAWANAGSSKVQINGNAFVNPPLIGSIVLTSDPDKKDAAPAVTALPSSFVIIENVVFVSLGPDGYLSSTPIGDNGRLLEQPNEPEIDNSTLVVSPMQDWNSMDGLIRIDTPPEICELCEINPGKEISAMR